MFGGSKNIPSYDEPLQRVGGENNAFTSPDITNYYITLPVENLETAFWLESDRMLSLSFDPKVLEVQRSVVIEEFKQRYLNQPYGDVWLKLRPLAYEVHPYRWATIGKEISHIENATMTDVKEFFYSHYLPNNATLVVGGKVSVSQIETLAKKWFGDIPAGKINTRNLPFEPIQTAARRLETTAKVPLNAIYKSFHVPGRYDANYHAIDLLSDVLGRGKSARLHQKLVKEAKLFNNISAYTTGSLDPGMFVISGNLNQGVDLKIAENALNEEIENIKNANITETELEKVKHQAMATSSFGEVELLNRVMNIAFAANAGDVNYCNQDKEKIEEITADILHKQAVSVLREENCSTLIYGAE